MTIKEAPYLLTLLFGALGYTFTSLSENLYNTPILEYNIMYRKDTVNYIDCRITNISREKYYDKLYFELNHESNRSHFERALLNSEFPYFMNHEERLPEDVQHMGFDYYKFSIQSLVPFSTYKIRINYTGEELSEVRLIYDIRRMREEKFEVKDISVYLRKSDLLSWIAKNQIEFSVILIGVWIGLIIIFFIITNKRYSKIKSDS